MKKTLSKTDVEKQVEEFFLKIIDKTPKEVKKIKRLAMAYSIKLGEKRKTFCKKCFMPYKDASIRIKNGLITMTCGNCKNKSRWKVKG